jgi:hypothetical protein
MTTMPVPVIPQNSSLILGIAPTLVNQPLTVYFIMLGNFQKSELRIEVPATATTIRDRLLSPPALSKWLFPQQMNFPSQDLLTVGTNFKTSFGPVVVESQVDRVNSQCLRILLSQGIDGYHEWYWGEGWVQSRLEGISLLPVNLYQTATLFRLRKSLELGFRL